MDYSKITLGELLSSFNQVIRRHATGILKEKQNEKNKWKNKDTCQKCGEIHDVEKAGGHDLLQAEKILKCECKDYPEDEFCREVLKD